MKLDVETLQKIAHLSRLEINEEDTDQMLRDMSNMLTFVEKLNEVSTDGIAPLTTMSHEINNIREDVAKVDLTHDEVLSNAPKKDKDYFRVPKVLE
ncbi:MAG: Asp-tRNA(Asn)/Glu-tRNA(Gln) amidotransferase subunit GatC [Cytophagales bacterium]|jgi:aspartyl-tRNA(Asn)/glutamyl-tRNA(Gln) amidotransferase subunit C|nr:Asp-tRNA(Asn)/Glu-tRNA(Gln) amidotransferase subunit GatC [Cytophagales bacterium]MCA6386866.1 Asp-tRNA(Asn)/Glu-tRNA(Gln) amidotransferase subunit GatC [Cytophagales bacterium]MCA6390833.1 Asp-tRNA(Asn)/Glu-tRNA(Gln) amidotransferase subunit GatC [Cytophagales bacterium]MCA6396607.1 Asp-tRNA(Asn)/Glu-tRNA(Gln) amidotransferase subunit GatC [Cytophagales bacterium]MCA6397551.1 Asp-tRNA(Asn)/Glu-tRNA(Gln) amidotransferase subunit GatC [Cytophagales bacterium]